MYTIEKQTIDTSKYNRDISGKYLATEDKSKAVRLVTDFGIILEITNDAEGNETFHAQIYSKDFSQKISLIAYDYKDLREKVMGFDMA